MPRKDAALNDMSRVWAQEDGAAPNIAPAYMSYWRAGGISKDYGEADAVEVPSDAEYQKFVEVATLPGTEEKPTIDLVGRYRTAVSEMLRMARRACTHDFQIHIGKCRSPQDFLAGWEKIVAIEDALISNYSTDDLGALSSDDRAEVNETISIQAVDIYEIMPVSFAEICATSVIQEVIAVVYCDTKTCGECGEISDGCQKLFGVVLAQGGSPGLGAQVVYSSNGGSTCAATPITTLAANEDPDDAMCMGDYLIVVSEDSGSHHYADKDLILLGTETWSEHTGGYEVGGEPRCCWALNPAYAWIGGAGGYIYFLDNVANNPVVQDAGSATAQDINDIHALDEEHVIAVGNSNAVVYTTDGQTWTSVVGPTPGVNLNACWMLTETAWLVGTAGGELYYTLNSGSTWTEKQFPGSGAGQVRDIVFDGKLVGYLAHDTATPAGRILRTIDGGYQWYVLPETGSDIPANDRINSLAVCGNRNEVVGGGLADNATDGIMVKAA